MRRRQSIPSRSARVRRRAPASRAQARAAHRDSTRRKALTANVGAIAAGAVGVALASAVGVGELMTGGFLAYVAYRVIRYGVAPTEALIEGVELEHGQVPKSDANVVA